MFWHKKEAARALPDLPPMKFAPAAQSFALSPAEMTHDDKTESAEAADAPDEKHALPSFPDSPLQKGFAQAAIKDAVATPDMNEEHDMPEEADFVASSLVPASSIRTVEVDEGSAAAPALELPAVPVSPALYPPVLQAPSLPSLRQAPRRREMPLPLPPPPAFPQPMPMNFTAFPMPSQRAQKNTDIFVKLDRFTSAKRALEATNQKLDEIDSLLHKIRETKMREEQELASWERDLATIKARIKEVTETIFEKVD